MRLEQLRYLSALQYSHSISKTAKQFYISQQSLSNNIQQLENELNTTLLVRSPLGVMLTPEAEALLKISDPFLEEYDTLCQQLAMKETPVEQKPQRLRIYSSSVLITNVLPQAIVEFNKIHPDVRISIKEISYKEAFPAIENNECHLAFLSINDHYFLDQLRKQEHKDFHHHILLKDQLVTCVSAHTPFAKKEIIEQDDLAQNPFTYLDIVPLKIDSNDHSNMALYNSGNIEFHRRAIREIDAISLMPRYVYKNLFDSKVFVSKYLEGAKQTIYHAALYPTTTPHPVTKALVSIVSTLL